ncbi:MAG TPA: hypothetical protein VFZ22_02445 [Pyrinomonadaceae bacterium]|nr:hypothetical protein [Pyrinomonadaceae bacterium]
MNDESVTDALLRDFLLDKVDDEVRRHIENLLPTDTTMRERVFAAEQDLIDDYLEDSLSPEDEEKFRSFYAQTARQQRELRITKSIKEWAVAEYDAKKVNVPVEHDAPTTTGKRLWWRPAFVVPLAAVIVIAVVFGIIWVNRRIEQRRYAAIEAEVAQLNSPATLRETPPPDDALTLRPLTLRSAEQRAELKIRPDVGVAELNLLWPQTDRYQSYRFTLRRVDDQQPLVAHYVPAPEDGKTIRLRLPAGILNRGLYRLELSGVTASGGLSAAEEYSFTVVE